MIQFFLMVEAASRCRSRCYVNRRKDSLNGLGHTRIAFLITRLSLSSNSARLEGFRQAMQERAIPVRSDYLLTELRGVKDGYKSGLRLLDLPERPTAILCSNSALLLGLVRALGERRGSLPSGDKSDWLRSYNVD